MRSTRSTGERGVVQSAGPSRVWGEMMGRWEMRPEKPQGSQTAERLIAGSMSAVPRQWGATEFLSK